MNHRKNNLLDQIRILAKSIIGIPLTIVALLFIGRFILQAFSNTSFQITHLNIFSLILGIICFIGFFIIKAFIWNTILEKDNINIPKEKSLFIYAYSELRRYIPGNVFSFISRATYLTQHKVAPKKSTTLMAIEALILVLSAAIASIPALTLTNSFFQNQYSIYNQFGIIPQFITMGIFCSLIFLMAVFFIYRFVLNRFNLPPFFFLKYKETFLLALFMWFLYGLGNYFVALSITYIDPALFVQFCSLFVAAWLIGYITIVFPMGLGIREGIVTGGFASYAQMAIPIAAFISIFSRIILIIVELASVGILYFFKERHKTIMKIFKKISVHELFLYLATLSYITYFSYVSIEKYDNFFSGRFDLGNMTQTVWNTIHGRIFMLTNPDSTNIVSRLGTHADFLLILISPFYLIWEDPRMLLLIQAICIGLGALFVYFLAKEVLGNKTISLILAISYLLNPWVQRQNLYDFHSVSLATTFLLGAFYFLFIKKRFWFLVFLLLAVLTKENIFLIAAIFGLYIAIKGRIKFGLGLTIISSILFYLLVAKFIPQARGGAHFALSYFSDFGATPSAVIKTILFNPTITIPKIITQEKINYLSELLIPTGYLSLLSPFYLIFTFPELLINLLSNNANLRSINFHYGAAIVPFVYVSTIYGIQVALKQKKINIKPSFISYYLVIITIFTTWNFGVLPGARYPSLEVFTQKLEDRQVISQFLDTIPTSYSVAATNNLGAHLSHREKIYTIPNGIDQADIVLFLLNDQFAQPSLADQEKMVEKLSLDPTYTNVFEDDPFIVFTKKKVHGLEVNF